MPPVVRLSLALLLLLLSAPGAALAQQQKAASKLDDPLQKLTPAEKLYVCQQLTQLRRLFPQAADALATRTAGRANCTPEGIERATAALAKEKKAAAKKEAGDFDDRLAKVRALQDAGFEDESRKQLQALVADHPTEDVPSSLRKPDQRPAGWRDALGEAGPIGVVVVEALALGLALALAVVLLLYLGGRFFKRFDAQVELAKIDAGEGVDITSAFQDYFAKLKDDRQSDGVKFVAPTDGGFKLPEAVTKTFPQTELLAGLLGALDSLLPRNLVRVSGTVRGDDPDLGAGLTLQLTDRHGRTSAQTTVWEKTYRLPKTTKDGTKLALAERYERLVGAAAAWLAYRKEMGAFDAGDAPLGCADWRSYAHFAVAPLTESPTGAYRRALDLDPGNQGARLNLAGHLLDALPSVEEDGRDSLTEAKELLEPVLEVEATSPLWYRSRYLMGVAHLYEADRQPAGKGAAAKAVEMLDQLLAGIASPPKGSASLRPLLRALRLPATVSRQSAVLLRGDQPPPDDFLAGTWRSAATRYNLACLYARCAERLPAKKETYVDNAFDDLGPALEQLGADGVESARTDPALTPLHEDERWPKLVPPKKKPPPDRGPIAALVCSWLDREPATTP